MLTDNDIDRITDSLIIKLTDIGVIKKVKRFIPPLIEEVEAYILLKGYSVDAELFYHHYKTNDWMRGKTKIKNWKACVTTWEKSNNAKSKSGNQTKQVNDSLNELMLNEIENNTFTDELGIGDI